MSLTNEIILKRIQEYIPKRLPITEFKAAVLIILLVDESEQITIVLTKRTDTLARYAGHYSFPGGMYDRSDVNLLETAKRETKEELNIPEEAYQLIGELNDFHDRYGNLVRPFVAVMQQENFDVMQKIALDEVAEVYFFPLARMAELCDDPTLHAITKRRPSYSFRQDAVFIWGLTASILVHLRDVIFNHF